MNVVRITRSGASALPAHDQISRRVISGSLGRFIARRTSRSACCNGISRYGKQRHRSGDDVDHAQGQDRRIDIEKPTQGKIRHLLRDRSRQQRQAMLDAEVGAIADRDPGPRGRFP